MRALNFTRVPFPEMHCSELLVSLGKSTGLHYHLVQRYYQKSHALLQADRKSILGIRCVRISVNPQKGEEAEACFPIDGVSSAN